MNPNYQHGDLIKIKADGQIAMVDYYSWYQGLIYIFDPLSNHTSMAFFTDEVEPVKETQNA